MGEAGLFRLVLILEPLSVNGHGLGENVQKNGQWDGPFGLAGR